MVNLTLGSNDHSKAVRTTQIETWNTHPGRSPSPSPAGSGRSISFDQSALRTGKHRPSRSDSSPARDQVVEQREPRRGGSDPRRRPPSERTPSASPSPGAGRHSNGASPSARSDGRRERVRDSPPVVDRRPRHDERDSRSSARSNSREMQSSGRSRPPDSPSSRRPEPPSRYARGNDGERYPVRDRESRSQNRSSAAAAVAPLARSLPAEVPVSQMLSIERRHFEQVERSRSKSPGNK